MHDGFDGSGRSDGERRGHDRDLHRHLRRADDHGAARSGQPGQRPAGNTVSGPLGTVTVTDARGGTPTSDWIARVSSTSFVGPADTIPSANATYTPQSGTVVVGNGILSAGTAGSLAAQRISMSYTGGTGNSQATWSPVLAVSIPLVAGLGTYTGTVTHSVS